MIKIYFNDKKIYLTDSYEQLVKKIKLSSAIISFDFDTKKLNYLIDDLLISENEYLILVGNPEEILASIKKICKLVLAAGGVVTTPKSEILFIYRRRKWDLPKGKLDEGETIEECAIREVKEETGLTQLHLGDPIMKSYHIYIEEDMVIKETHWFYMFTSERFLNPQKEEGIKKANWIHPNNIQFQLNNTYESIIDLIHEVLN